jgi:hypothetical protein
MKGKKKHPSLMNQAMKLKRKNMKLRKNIKEFKRHTREFLKTRGSKTLVDAAKTFDKVTSTRKMATKKPQEDLYSVWEDIFIPIGYSPQDIKFRMTSTQIEVESREVGVLTSEFPSLFLQEKIDK